MSQVVGLDNLDAKKTYFFASNHESHFDACLIFSTLPFWLISLAKKSLLYVPIFGWAVAAGGTVWVDRKNTSNAVNSMANAAKSLTKRPGRSVIVFPEGTRSRDGNLQPFKKGGIVLALQTGMPIVPVCVGGTINVIGKGARWVTPGQKLTVIYGKPIPTEGLTVRMQNPNLPTRTIKPCFRWCPSSHEPHPLCLSKPGHLTLCPLAGSRSTLECPTLGLCRNTRLRA